MSKAEKAREFFLQGYNCSQAVALAFAEETGVDSETLAKAALSFGGGLSRLRLTCGTVSGMCLVAGLILGSAEPGKGKSEHYAIIQSLVKAFKEKNGSVICAELLRGITSDTSPQAEARTPEYYKKRPCPDYVYDAAHILEEYLNGLSDEKKLRSDKEKTN